MVAAVHLVADHVVKQGPALARQLAQSVAEESSEMQQVLKLAISILHSILQNSIHSCNADAYMQTLPTLIS